MPRPRPTGNALLTTVTALLLGAVTALAVPIVLGLTCVPPDADRPSLRRAFIAGGRVWVVHERARPGLVQADWSMQEGSAADPARALEGTRTALADAEDPVDPPVRKDRPAAWGSFELGASPPLYAGPPVYGGAPVKTIGRDYGYGWPAVALWGRVLGHAAGGTAWTDGADGLLAVSGSPTLRSAGSARVVPLRPCWPGLAVNTVVMSVLWAPVLVGLSAVRRRGRLRRGLCAPCGYDLQGSRRGAPCPECGRV